MVIGDPFLLPSERKPNPGVVVHCICILNHPIPSTNDAESVSFSPDWTVSIMSLSAVSDTVSRVGSGHQYHCFDVDVWRVQVRFGGHFVRFR
jgi:hypothetical protein